MKRLILLVLVCALVIPMFSVASAAKQLYGETIMRGSDSDFVFNETQAGADFSNVWPCLEFCLYANSNAYQEGTYIRTNVYYSFSSGGYGTRVASATYEQTLAAGAGLFFPAQGEYHRVVGDKFSVYHTRYYRTVLNTNMPYAITGSYRGWISNLKSGD